jgi:hypothetical protein
LTIHKKSEFQRLNKYTKQRINHEAIFHTGNSKHPGKPAGSISDNIRHSFIRSDDDGSGTCLPGEDGIFFASFRTEQAHVP